MIDNTNTSTEELEANKQFFCPDSGSFDNPQPILHTESRLEILDQTLSRTPLRCLVVI